MDTLSDITSFDVIVVLLFLLFIIRGTWIGFMRQLAIFLALIGSFLFNCIAHQFVLFKILNLTLRIQPQLEDGAQRAAFRFFPLRGEQSEFEQDFPTAPTPADPGK